MFILYRMKKENDDIHFTSGSFPEMFSENTKNKPELFPSLRHASRCRLDSRTSPGRIYAGIECVDPVSIMFRQQMLPGDCGVPNGLI